MNSDKSKELVSTGSQSAPDGAEPSRRECGGQVDQTIAQLRADLADRDMMIDRLRRFIPPIVADGIFHDQERLRGERREVTVLFLDAVDFTRLSVSLDAEAIFNLINDLLSRLIACVHRYGGLVDKFTGDGLMAVFGAPVAHENDAELAVRAAIDIQQAAAGFAEIARAQLGAPVQIRIGINRGPVIAGVLGTQEQSAYTVIGETVNLAARIEAIAQPGSILVSSSVYARTQSFFTFGPPQTAVVKGVDAPVEIHEALSFRASPTSPRGVPGMAGPYLGRDTQLAQLREFSDTFLAGGQGCLITVTGDAGLGKSRLISEWLTQIPPDSSAVWRGQGLPYAEGTAYGVFRSLLRDALDSYPDPNQWQSRVSEPFRPLIRQLLELPQPESEEALWEHLSPERTSQLTALGLREWLINETKDHPLILVLDDFHWADDLSRQVLQSLLALVTESRILFCIMMRPHADAGLDSTHLDPAMCHHITVTPLTDSESHVLLSNFVDLDGVPDATVETILTRAEGNPFYIEEFVRMLIEQEVLHLQDG
ncbi:MAG: AAA family ATPase, partial [Anaerolineae bacterium]|nr:AAA family ATPase [Anaerolineae bacterium]